MLSNSGVRSAPMATSKASVPISWAFIIRALSPRRGQPVNAHTLHKVSAWGFHPFPQKNIFLMPEGIKPPLAGLREVRTQSSGKLGKADGEEAMAVWEGTNLPENEAARLSLPTARRFPRLTSL